MERLFSFGFLALPTVFITLSLAGALLALVWRRLGIALAIGSSLCLYLAATPALSSYLLRAVEAAVPGDVDYAAAQAIVVLSGDVHAGNKRDIPDRLGPLSLERLVLAADAYRRLHLPLAVSGGRLPGTQESAAVLMAAALGATFSVPVKWREASSRTTWENALFTAALVKPDGVTTVVVVTHASHLPRALWSFERAGLKALPWPAPRTALRLGRVGDFLPSLAALGDSFEAVHEIIGGVYYPMRH